MLIGAQGYGATKLFLDKNGPLNSRIIGVNSARAYCSKGMALVESIALYAHGSSL